MPRSSGSDDENEIRRVERILRDLDVDTVDGVEPPAEIWAGIESALAEERRVAPRRAPTRGARQRLTIEYRIDADDIVRVDPTDRDAVAEVPEFAVPEDGRRLWAHMAPGATQEIWRALVGQVRRSGATVTVPFRCDGPTARRWFEMVVTAEPDGSVGFRSSLIFEEARDPVSLLAADVDRDDELEPVVLCAWCGRGEDAGEWLELEDLVSRRRLLEATQPPPIEAAVCGACRDEMAAEFQALAVVEG